MTFIEKTKKEFFRKFIGERWNEMELPFLIAKINGFLEEKIKEAMEIKMTAMDNIPDDIGTTHEDAEGVVIEEKEK